MANYKTPGVYVEEIPRLGSSIAGVPTAVAGFTGYTQTAIIDGEQWDYNDGPAPPVRITSLLEYQEIFGGPKPEIFDVSLTGIVPTPTTIAVTPITTASGLSKYILFYQIRMFFANGGGTCWVVSVGPYSTNPIDKDELIGGVQLFEQIDEVTLLCTPETVFLQSTPNKEKKAVYEEMVSQCAKLQDRFAILDTVHKDGNTIFQDGTSFRDNDIGPDNLKYVATYYPGLDTSLEYFYNEDQVTINDDRTQGSYPFNYDYDTAPNNKLSTISNGTFASIDVQIVGGTTALLTADKIIINVGTSITLDPTNGPTASDAFDSVKNIVDLVNSHPTLSPLVKAIDTSIPLNPKFRLVSKLVGTIGNTFTFQAVVALPNRYSPDGQPTAVNFTGGISVDKDLYNRIKAELAKYTLTLYPSASMAGVYARVDNTRGVWKAPANVGLALTNEPAIIIDAESQENLNVDSVSGKSINAVRQFAGRGTLVWGARTLAGNDNEWRYINVRRLFIYVEESCKKATEFVVFESNTANTWNRVKNMIEAFLTDLWRDGALAGATTKDAFFVQVGLGQTMTSDDILNGKMIVRIGMAAARPAEFIILQFEHKLQES